MDLQLQDKPVLVTGASNGIGRATALSLAREGADLVLCSRGKDRLDAVAEEVRGLGRSALAVQGDVGNQDDRERLAETIASEVGTLYGFVSNATNTEALHGPLTGMPEHDLWDKFYAVDVLGAVRLTELLSPAMCAAGEGSIVFISSVAGKRAIGVAHGYVAMKSAVIAAGKTLALELGRSGVRVNTVAPGTTSHPGAFIEASKVTDRSFYDEHMSEIPSGRFSTPDEVADCITFVLSPRSVRMLGHCLVVDGGEYHGIH